MSELPSQARVVIIGGGVVGASALYHLAKAGWRDCVLLEKNELTAGSTWHAAGNIPTFSPNWAIMNMQRYGAELYRSLGDTVDYPINYHVTGSVRLAHSLERMLEFQRARSMAAAQGMTYEMLDLVDLKDRHPFLETHDLEGGLWDPLDGDIDPAQATQAFAKGARDHGAHIQRYCSAQGIRREGDDWVVQTDSGDIRCEKVVNAAGYYSQRVASWFEPYGGRRLPMMVMSHQYLLTDEINEIEQWTKDNGRKLPLLRDVDSSYYLRQEKSGLNLGPYELNCRGHWMSSDDPFPEDFSFQLFPDDLERLEWYIEDAIARVPALGTAGITKVINGPIPYTPDGNPLIGPSPGLGGVYEACVFTFGIAQAGGAGKVLAEWVTEGETEWDVWACDPRRFTGFADQTYCDVKGMEVYGHEYAMHFPRHAWPAGRNRRLSALHSHLQSEGAVFGSYNGWERADWFAQPGDDVSEATTQTWSRRGPWEQRTKEECEAVRDQAGMIAITGFSRLRLQGDGARQWLDRLTPSRIPKVGRVGLLYFCDERGRIVTEMSVIPEGDDDILLITAAVAQWHDKDLLHARLPTGLSLVDETDATEAILVTGPMAREMLAPISDTDLSLPWLSSQKATVAGVASTVLRVSFAGELGWEVHAPAEQTPKVWEALRANGAKPIGMFALDSLRIEKGYRSWKGDLSTDYTLLESGLERLVDLDKPQYPGRDALLRERERGSDRQFVSLRVDAKDHDAPYMASLFFGDERVGEATSGAMGYRAGSSVALGMLRSNLATDGTKIEVDIFGERRRAVVVSGAVWDPKNERLRA